MTESTAQLRKGTLELAILTLLADKPRYGGEIIAALADFPGLEATAGTIYPLLARLAKSEQLTTSWVESPSGPPRKYYALSATGRRELSALATAWSALRDSLDQLLADNWPQQERTH